MSSTPILYGMVASPPVRAVLLTIAALDIDVDLKIVNTLKGEQFSPEFLKMNPQHTVPTLEDDGHYIWDSHAIMAYLVRKYGKNDSLYPQDFYVRAVVDQRLHFEGSTIMKTFLEIGGAILRNAAKREDLADKFKLIYDALDLLEKFLDDHLYMAGDQLTIADFSIVSSFSTLVAIIPFDADKYPKLSAWYARIQQLPYYEKANVEGLHELADLLNSKL